MKHGDFTNLAKHYVNRPGYSKTVLAVLTSYCKAITGCEKPTAADVGAGTGKLTENLIELGLGGFAVEPNDAMRMEGIAYTANQPCCGNSSKKTPFHWSEGAAEVTGLQAGCVDWVLMGSSFHWAKADEALPEFNRILKNRGMFTAIYNPRDIEKNELHQTIEKKIKEIVPELNRVSSGASHNTLEIENKLQSTGLFGNLFFCEAAHVEVFSKERYIGAWMSVNDIQVQAGEKRWEQILDMIEHEISTLKEIEVPYKTRAWTIIKN